MAQVYPLKLDQRDIASPAEREVLRHLRKQLDGRWKVFPSLELTDSYGSSGRRDYEIDLVVCHANRGVLCLEVKGGEVRLQDGDWVSRDRRGNDHKISDPFKQVRNNRYALERSVVEKKIAQKGRWNFARAVVLPEVSLATDQDLGPHAPRDLVLDCDQIRDVEHRIVSLLERSAAEGQPRREAPGEDGLELLRRHLARTTTLPVTLEVAIKSEREKIIELTTEQVRVARRLRHNDRQVISGPAGSGKTVIATRHAEWLAHNGAKVLFLCFNRGLAEFLNEQAHHPDVTYATFHQLCGTQAELAGVEVRRLEPGEDEQVFYGQYLPDALVDAVAILGPQYDALILDEGQDMRQAWFETLLLTLKEEDRSHIWIFRDLNQQVYGGDLQVPDGYAEFVLDINYRNTREIHREAQRFYTGEDEISPLGPPGRKPERIIAADQVAEVERQIERLGEEEHVRPSDIVVVSPHGRSTSRVYQELRGDYPFRERGSPEDKPFFSSIRGYKGLEVPVVIVCETEDLEGANRKKEMYIALTRALNHAIVIESPKADT